MLEAMMMTKPITPYGEGEIVGLTADQIKRLKKMDAIRPLTDDEKSTAKESHPTPAAMINLADALATAAAGTSPKPQVQVVEKQVAVVIPPEWEKMKTEERVALANKLKGEGDAITAAKDADAAIKAAIGG